LFLALAGRCTDVPSTANRLLQFQCLGLYLVGIDHGVSPYAIDFGFNGSFTSLPDTLEANFLVIVWITH